MPLLKRELDESSDALSIAWSFSRTVDAVWQHLTDPANLSRWLGQPISFDSMPGGEILIDHAEGYICRSVVKQVEPANFEFAISWQFPDEPLTQVEVAIRPSDDRASILTLRHLELGALRDSYADGWVTHLTFFEASLNGTPMPMDEFWNLHGTIVALGDAM